MTRSTVALFNMLEGLYPVRNVLAVGDPNVHQIDGTWTMFLGGFTTRFRVSLFSATLPFGAPLSSNEWTLTTQPGRPHRALPIVADPPKGQWDHHGMHTPAYVEGRTSKGAPERRIYYAGRSSAAHFGPDSRYAIGLLRQVAGRWVRHGPPVHVGTPERPSVLEPLIRFDDGRWRLWYLSTVSEPGPGELPDYRIEYTESADGISGWSPPRVFFPTEDGYFDGCVQRVDDHFEMIVARGTNLHGTPGYPAQGLWFLDSVTGSGDRADWASTPVRLLDTDVDAMPWFANGSLGPSFHYGDTDADRDTMYVFFTGTHAKVNWFATAARRIARLQRPPIPAPFHLTTGRMAFERPRRDPLPRPEGAD